MEFHLSQQQLDAVATTALAWFVAFVPKLVAAIVIVVIGLLVARWVSRGLSRLLGSSTHVDPTVRPVVTAVVRYAIIVLVAVFALGQLGVQTASLLAVLGAAGLAIGLALQGTLTNIAAGIMLLWLRPFRIGDYIEVSNQNVAGTVKEIGLFVCQLETFDGITLFAPNSTIWNYALRNHSRNDGRLINLLVTLPHATDVAAATHAMRNVFEASPHVRKSPPPSLFIDSITGDGYVLNCSLWTTHEGFGHMQRTIQADILEALRGAGMDAVKPPSIRRTIPADSDPSRLLAIRRAVDEDAALAPLTAPGMKQ